MKRFGWPRPAFMIGFVLSGQLENGLYRVAQVYGFSFLERPVVLVLLVILALSVAAAVRFRPERAEAQAGGAHAPENKAPQLVFYSAVLAITAIILVLSFRWNFGTGAHAAHCRSRNASLADPGRGEPTPHPRSPAAIFYDSEREEFAEGVDRQSASITLFG